MSTPDNSSPNIPPTEMATSNAASPAPIPDADAPTSGATFIIPPIDRTSRQLTARALLTGMVIGGTLSVCNIYTGLLIGWGTNMSITGILIAFALWHAISLVSFGRVKPLTMLENNINQSACSAAAAVSSAGLVAPIPALTMMTGQALPWHWLALWVFCVCLVGISAAIVLRRQMIVVDQLPFPGGMACAATLKEVHGQGKQAIQRVSMMAAAALVAAAVKVGQIVGVLKAVGLASLTIKGHSSKSLGFELEPNLLMVGVGGLIGLRGCISLIIGSIIGWGIAAPHLINSGHLGLAVATPMVAPPPELEAADKLLKLEYRPARHELRAHGIIDQPRLERLLAISPDPRFQGAVEKLHAQSQLEISAPLNALPAGIVLNEAPVAFDADRRVLIAKKGLTSADVDALRALNSDPAWLVAVDQLASWFDYRVTMPLNGVAPLDGWPKGLIIPQALSGALHYKKPDPKDPAKNPGMIVAKGPLSEPALAALQNQAAKLSIEHPDRAEHVAEAIAAIQTASALAARQDVLASIPPSLESITLDPAANAISVIGPMAPATHAALKALNPDDPSFQATVASLNAASQFKPAKANTGDVLEWLLWPGVVLMVVSSLVGLSFSGPAMLRAFRGSKGPAAVKVDGGDVSKRWFIAGASIALICAVIAQVAFFEIKAWAAVVGVLLSFILAVVATRVSGETNVTPIGAMGKVTQLAFGVMDPTNPAANLMAANVTGGSASQCADLMHDLKCGYMLGATARKQAVAQIAGALSGSLLGSMFYLILIPNPREQLMTDQWPAPAVATWKAVAELFKVGFEALPQGTPAAMLIAGVLGVALPVLEKSVAKKWRYLVPSAAAMGLALVIMPRNAISMLVGAILAYILAKVCKTWTERFLVTICAGVIAGESLTGAGDALRLLFMGS
jgi:uncharacterized oligopeptide transporter (OPT) family protein